MANSKGEYTGTFIPAHIMLDESLSAGGKILYAVIASFNVCFMSNAGLAKRLGVTERSIQRGISDLKERGYVQQVGFNGKTRQICPCRDDTNVVSATTQTSPIDKNLDKNLDNTYVPSKEATSVFEELRKVFGSTERYKFSPKRQKLLKARLKDFSKDDLLAGARELSLSEFHNGDNPHGTIFAEPEWYLKDYERVEHWVLQATEGTSAPDPENRGKLKVDLKSINWDEV